MHFRLATRITKGCLEEGHDLGWLYWLSARGSAIDCGLCPEVQEALTTSLWPFREAMYIGVATIHSLVMLANRGVRRAYQVSRIRSQ